MAAFLDSCQRHVTSFRPSYTAQQRPISLFGVCAFAILRHFIGHARRRLGVEKMQKVANAVGDAVARKFSERGVDHLDAVASGHLDVAANCLAVLLYLRAYSYTCPVTSLRQLSRDQLSACSVRAVSYCQIFPWSPPILTLYPCSVRLSLSDIHLTPTTQVVVVGRLSVYLSHPPTPPPPLACSVAMSPARSADLPSVSG